MTLENWTIYTETDPGGDLTVTANQIAVSTMATSTPAGVWKDFLAAYFGNFDHDIDTRCTAIATNALHSPWLITNVTTGQYDGNTIAAVYWLGDSTSQNVPSLWIENYPSQDVWTAPSLNAIYYLTIIRTTTPSNSFRCEIYSDSGRTSLLDTISVTYFSTTCRYISSGANSAFGADSFSGDHYNLNLNETRFYLPSSGAAAVSPAFNAAWEETGDADRLKMVITKIASAMTDKSLTTLITAGDALCRQYVSDPLEAQTITGDVKIYARAFEALATIDAVSRIVLKVVSGDGGTIRGTLFAFADYSTGTEWNTSLRNKSFANGDVPTSVTAQAGDRLVLEIGFNHAAVISSAGINFGDDSATDLPPDETTTAANNPWLQISQTLIFAAVAGAATRKFQRASVLG